MLAQIGKLLDREAHKIKLAKVGFSSPNNLQEWIITTPQVYEKNASQMQ
jgi:hypothetical protein